VEVVKRMKKEPAFAEAIAASSTTMQRHHSCAYFSDADVLTAVVSTPYTFVNRIMMTGSSGVSPQ